MKHQSLQNNPGVLSQSSLAIDKNNLIVLLQKKITHMYASLIETIFHVITQNHTRTLCQNYDDFLKIINLLQS